MTDRREFLGMAGGALLGAAFSGCAGAGAARGRPVRAMLPRETWAFLAHLGAKMWERRVGNTDVQIDMDVWHKLGDRMAEKGLNVLVVDLGEAVRYPSAPEIGLPGAWEPETLEDEIARLKSMGVLAIPKLNFSTSHDQWLGKWRNYVGTDEYHALCAGIIRDVADIFDEAPAFHLGYDEETYSIQKNTGAKYIRLRVGDIWWKDFLWFVGQVESHGMRPWTWSDYGWKHRDEFLSLMPKSVLQSNWYYCDNFDPVKSTDYYRPMLEFYRVLSDAGYDQIPCGSTYSPKGLQFVNFPKTVEHCRSFMSSEHLKGFLMAPWIVELKKENLPDLLASVDIVGKTRNACLP